jgi:hypothetical protein
MAFESPFWIVPLPKPWDEHVGRSALLIVSLHKGLLGRQELYQRRVVFRALISGGISQAINVHLFTKLNGILHELQSSVLVGL